MSSRAMQENHEVTWATVTTPQTDPPRSGQGSPLEKFDHTGEEGGGKGRRVVTTHVSFVSMEFVHTFLPPLQVPGPKDRHALETPTGWSCGHVAWCAWDESFDTALFFFTQRPSTRKFTPLRFEISSTLVQTPTQRMTSSKWSGWC